MKKQLIEKGKVVFKIIADFEYYTYKPELKTTNVTIRNTKWILTTVTSKYITFKELSGFYRGEPVTRLDSVKFDTKSFSLDISMFSKTRIKAIEKEISLIPSNIKGHEDSIEKMSKEREPMFCNLDEIKSNKIFVELYKTKVPRILKSMLTKEKKKRKTIPQ
jgi:hypothetical protein